MTSDDPIRTETRDLAAQLGPRRGRPALTGPPPRVAAPTVDANTDADEAGAAAGEAEAGDERPDGDSAPATEPAPADEAGPTPTPDTDAVATQRRASSRRRRAAADAASSAATTTSVVLTPHAEQLLEAERRRTGKSSRDVMLDAVRSEIDELRRRHAAARDPSGPIPRTPVRRRSNTDGYGRNISVRFHEPERDALRRLADELETTVSAMITDAVVLALSRSDA